MTERQTQCQEILAAMERGREITQLDALRDFGVMRLASRISDLRSQGHPIAKRMKRVTARNGRVCSVAAYRIERDAQDIIKTDQNATEHDGRNQ